MVPYFVYVFGHLNFLDTKKLFFLNEMDCPRIWRTCLVCLKMFSENLTNIVDPDQTAPKEQFDQGLKLFG